MPKTIQERAWTSPIWYRPEGLAEVRGRVSFGSTPGADRLALRARVGRLPQGADLAALDLRIAVSDDDTIWEVVIPAGALRPRGARRFEYRDPAESLAGLQRAAVSVSRRGEATLKVRTGLLDLAAADRTEHMVRVDVGAGTWTAGEMRLWGATARRLASP